MKVIRVVGARLVHQRSPLPGPVAEVVIARKKPLPRSTKPIPRKRAKARTYKTPRCVWGRCKKPQQHINRCVVHAKKHLDILWSGQVRKEECVVPHWSMWNFRCAGPIQANHGFDRGELGTRWMLTNGFSACAAMNVWAYRNKRKWYSYLREVWGEETYWAMEKYAEQEPDYERVLAKLTESAE